MDILQIVVINHSEDSTFGEDLVGDILKITTLFSAQLYGSFYLGGAIHVDRNKIKAPRFSWLKCS